MKRIIISLFLITLLCSCATQSYQLVNFPTRYQIKTKVDSLSVEKYEKGIRKWLHTPIGRFTYEGTYYKGEQINSYVRPIMMKVNGNLPTQDINPTILSAKVNDNK